MDKSQVYLMIIFLLIGLSLFIYASYKRSKEKIMELRQRPKNLDYSLMLHFLKTSYKHSDYKFSLGSMKEDLCLSWDECYMVIGHFASTGKIRIIHSIECEHCEYKNETESLAQFNEIKTCKMCYKTLNKEDGYLLYVHYQLTPRAIFDRENEKAFQEKNG